MLEAVTSHLEKRWAIPEGRKERGLKPLPLRPASGSPGRESAPCLASTTGPGGTGRRRRWAAGDFGPEPSPRSGPPQHGSAQKERRAPAYLQRARLSEDDDDDVVVSASTCVR